MGWLQVCQPPPWTVSRVFWMGEAIDLRPSQSRMALESMIAAVVAAAVALSLAVTGLRY